MSKHQAVFIAIVAIIGMIGFFIALIPRSRKTSVTIGLVTVAICGMMLKFFVIH